MIDFKNTVFFKLRPVDNSEFESIISPMFIEGETIIGTFKGIRDGVVFTNKRIISINVQGLTGQKKRLYINALQQNSSLLGRNSWYY